VTLHEALPQWPAGTVAILVTGGGSPHAIPVSAAVRAGADRVLIGLAAGRESLARLRRDPAVALAVLAEDLAVTIEGVAQVLEEELTEGTAAVQITAVSVQDHLRPTFELQSGVGWRWTDEAAATRDRHVRQALLELASRPNLRMGASRP